jgi:hypothetical protein
VNLPAGPIPSRRRNRERDTEDRVLVYQLRLAGHSYRAIENITADPDGPTHGRRIPRSTAQELAEAEAIDRVTPVRQAVIEMELDRLDAMFLAIAGRAATGDVAAIDRALRIQERRAKLLGLDAPTQQTVDATVVQKTPQDLELDELVREAQAREAVREARIKAGDTE